MNYRLLANFLGLFSIGLGLSMTPALICAAIYLEGWTVFAFAASMLICGGLGVGLRRLGQNHPPTIFNREALGLVAMSWIFASVLGALPFVFAGSLNYVDALFECASGFSTTGSSVMTNLAGTPRGIIFWRSFTHFLGGAGIIVLFIAVLPYLGAGGKLLFKSESSGPDKRGLTPKIKDTAYVVWMIYCFLTALQTGALLMAGMSLFDALCHSFGTLSSGGFSTRQLSVMEYNSFSIEVICTVFMVCAGTSFGTFFMMAKGDWLAPFKDVEWRLYIFLLVVFSIIIAFNLTGFRGVFSVDGQPIDPGVQYDTFSEALRYSTFQVVSVMTNTGFVSADFDQWPEFSRMLLIGIMFLGGCAGSTTAGLKLMRVIVLVKVVYKKIETMFRPKRVRAIRVNGFIVDEEAQLSVMCFGALLVGWWMFASLALTLMGVPMETAASAVACTLNGTGPGLEFVGAVRDFHAIPALGKLLLTFTMILGRLELFTLLVLLVPGYWKKD